MNDGVKVSGGEFACGLLVVSSFGVLSCVAEDSLGGPMFYSVTLIPSGACCYGGCAMCTARGGECRMPNAECRMPERRLTPGRAPAQALSR
jgi:hypothetical protein